MRLVMLSFLTAALACGSERRQPEPAPTPGPPAPPVARDGAGPPPASWVDERVRTSMARLRESEGGAVIAAAIDAHGGLRPWLQAGNIAFEFDYRPLSQPERRMHTYQRVDLWSARAVHEELEGGAGEEARFGWDGNEAWITPNAEAFPTPARFWALTPYYFVGIPFVLADPGARFEQLEDQVLDGVNHQLVKVTYEDGTGDAPDDYYIVYVDETARRVAALRYVVTYPGFFADGQHSPEKLMRYTELRTVAGLRFATRYDTFAWDGGAPGEKVTEIAVDRIALGADMLESAFARPDGAVVSELTPR
ncbi:MAG: hypothetical protein AAF938_12155 [Myxococcota bacterium]